MKHRAFISYSSRDTILVDEVESLLRRLGVDVWRDVNEITVAEDIEQAINTAISESVDVIVVALTNNALAAPWVEYEKRCAEEAVSRGAHLAIIYINLDKDTYVPAEIQKKLFVDLSRPEETQDYQGNLLRLAQFLIRRNPLTSLGVYDIYESFQALDSRRERISGRIGCSVDDYVKDARENLVAVGLWFGVLFGPNSGRVISTFLSGGGERTVDLYAPDPDKAPMAQLMSIHDHGSAQGIEERIRQFIAAFKNWGKVRQIQPSLAECCRLHLLNFIPVNSFLCTDYDKPYGRMILDIFAVGIEPDRQMKVELRYPSTPLYVAFKESLDSIRRTNRVTKTIITSSVSTEPKEVVTAEHAN